MPRAQSFKASGQKKAAKVYRRESRFNRLIPKVRTLSTPINSCPTEILSEIFHFASKLEGEPGSDTVTITRISHVCRQWRAIAVSCSTHWSTIHTFDSLPWVRLMLSRSSNAQLLIRDNEERQDYHLSERLALCEAVSHVNRLASVELCSSEAGFPAPLDEFFEDWTDSAPVLKTLDLALFTALDSTYAVDLPSWFLQGGAPLLERLTLVKCKVPRWGCLPIHGGKITSLALVDDEEKAQIQLAPVLHESHRPTGTEFLASLARMPLLETLVLSRHLPIDGYPDLEEMDPQPCMKLRRMEFVGSLEEMDDLFRVIEVPNAEIINLTLDGTISHSPSLQRLLSQVQAASLGKSTTRTLRKLSIRAHPSLDYAHLFGFGFYPTSQAPGSLSFDDASLVIGVAFHHGDDDPLEPFVSAFKETLDFSHVESLEVETESNDSLSSLAWDVIFGDLPKLQHVVVADYASLDFIEALHQYLLRFPALKTVVITASDEIALPSLLEDVVAIQHPNGLTVEVLDCERSDLLEAMRMPLPPGVNRRLDDM